MATTTPTLTPTFATGATAKPGDVVRVDPRRERPGDQVAPGLAEVGLNHGFVGDVLSAMLTHERCGRHLYRSVATRTNNPVLRRKYEEFGGETERHATILEDLVTQLGGDPQYVSPAARAVEGNDSRLLEATYLLAGSVDVMTQEMVMLDAVLLAESMDHANWTTLAQLTESLPEGPVRASFAAAVGDVLGEEEDHLSWARDTKARLTVMQASSKAMATTATKVEEMVDTVRGWLST
ncbi:MAG: hypothetical protein HYX34_00605 [Actinobacteria bacterium]|nr:hypothetical protein [Actinomycetota bacterium]